METDNISQFIKYVPMLNNTNSLNYAEVLANVLHDCLHQIPLEDFFNFILTLVASEKKDQFDESYFITLKLDSLKLCHLILQSFRLPIVIGGSFSEYSIHNFQLLSIDFDQIVRTFLAIKIILDAIMIIPDKLIENSISRTSVYKAYYIIWHKHIHSHTSFRNRLEQKHPAISISRFGKLMKLIYPEITRKRLGRRGESTSHYVGVQWNEKIIDADTKRLIDFTLPNLEIYFENSGLEERENYHVENRTEESHLHKVDYIETVSQKPIIKLLRLTTKKPLYSFVNLKSSLLTSDCFPCSWNTEFPQQSKWSKETMQKSVETLKEMNVDIEPLIKTFDIDMFYQESNVSFFDDVVQIIHLLFDRGLSGEAYLHLYLVVTLLIFPATLSPEKEGSNIVQIRLCKYLDIFLARLESEFIGLPLSDFCNLMCFSNIMKEMSNLNRLLVIRINTNLTKQVVKVMVDDVQSFTVDNQPKMNEIIYTAVIRGVNAFNWGGFDSDLKDNPEFQSTIKNLVEQFLKLCISMADDVASIPESMDNEDFQNTTYNLCFRIFKIFVKNFLEIFLSDTSMLLPVRLISFIFMDMSNDIHNLSFNEFSERDHDVSKKSFKNWWMFSAIVQTFIAILAEVTALSAHLD